MLNGEKPLSTNNSRAEEGQRKKTKMKHSNRNHSQKYRALQNAKKNNKTTKKKGSDRRTPS